MKLKQGPDTTCARKISRGRPKAAGALSRAGGRKNLYLKEKMDAYFTASAEGLK